MSQSTKKIIIICVIIWIILLGGTVLGILYFNNKEDNTYVKDNDNVVAKYTTRDYYSFYDENNLKIETLYIDENKKQFSYIKIDGLRNNRIQDKINKEIHDYATNQTNDKVVGMYTVVTLNSFNILSFYFSIVFDDTGSIQKAFNYDLNTGNQIKFDDLFTNTANKSSIVYDGVYNSISTNISSSLLSLNKRLTAVKLYGENGAASQYYRPGDNVADLEKEIAEKNQELNNIEDIVLKETRRIVKEDDVSFYLRNDAIFIYENINGVYQTIKLSAKKNMPYFAFYEKYLNNNNLYKNDNVGVKNMFLSGLNNSDIKYNRVEYVGDYALIDYTRWIDYNVDEITYIDKLVNEYKNKLDTSVFSYINIDSFSYKITNKKVIGVDGKISVCTMSKDYFNNTYLKELFDSKSKEGYGSNKYYIDEEDKNFNCESKPIKAFVADDKVYDKLSDIFVDGLDYEGYLIAEYYRKNYILYSEENMDALKQYFTFDFYPHGDIVIERSKNVNFNDLAHDIYITIKDIPSDYLKEDFK